MRFKIPEATQDIPPGTYKASLLGVEDKTGGSFGDGRYRLWDWLLDVNGESVAYSDTTSIGMGVKTNSYQRLQALMGSVPEVGQEYEAPIGKMVLLQIGRKENGFPKTDAVFPYVAPVTSEGGTPR